MGVFLWFIHLWNLRREFMGIIDLLFLYVVHFVLETVDGFLWRSCSAFNGNAVGLFPVSERRQRHPLLFLKGTQSLPSVLELFPLPPYHLPAAAKSQAKLELAPFWPRLVPFVAFFCFFFFLPEFVSFPSEPFLVCFF